MRPERSSTGVGAPEAALPDVGICQAEVLPDPVGTRRTGVLLILAGFVVISFVTVEALAETVIGSPEGERLRGDGESGALVGNAGEDVIHGFAGDDGLAGGAGSDELYGGAGRDVLLGGSGDDFLEAHDGQRDYLDCGAGRNDVASVDKMDEVAPGCEVVYRN